jgi:EAL domain-containing protein (putative c-di-GMP-specific phosphodiesterase class I)
VDVVSGDRSSVLGWTAEQREGVHRILDHVRTHLGMDIAWLSDFRGEEQLIAATSGDTASTCVAVGDRHAAEGSYCARVLSGELPAVIPDARRHPVTRELAVTEALGIGSYVGAPLRDDHGHAVGMLCCLSRGPRALDEEAERVMSLAVALVGDHLGPGFARPDSAAEHAAVQVRGVLDRRALRTVLQPVVDLVTGRVVGVEALARFDDFAGPGVAFAAASLAGLGPDLELLALERALERLGDVPPGAWLSLNVSAEGLLDDRVQALVLRHAADDLCVELTEHTQVTDYGRLLAVVGRLRAAGVRLAVDDAGAGYSSFRHILRLRPSMIKLDLEIIRGVDQDRVRQALTRSVVHFADEVGAVLVAEGIETDAENTTLRMLGVRHGQGYLHGRAA